jgi:predicted nucleic acid-binding protein
MISKFKQIAMPIINTKKEMKIYKPESIVGAIEKKLDNGEIGLNEAIDELRSAFKYNLSADDYRKIEKEAGYNVH